MNYQNRRKSSWILLCPVEDNCFGGVGQVWQGPCHVGLTYSLVSLSVWLKLGNCLTSSWGHNLFQSRIGPWEVYEGAVNEDNSMRTIQCKNFESEVPKVRRRRWYQSSWPGWLEGKKRYQMWKIVINASFSWYGRCCTESLSSKLSVYGFTSSSCHSLVRTMW